MIRYMTVAAAHTDFHRRLAALIAAETGCGGHMCDAGCGLGFLSRAMSPYYDKITAIDRAPQAVDVLRAQLESNISPICADISACALTEPYDHMVFCQFGRPDFVLRLARQQCRGTLLLIQRRVPTHCFSIGSGRNSRFCLPQTCGQLCRAGIAYRRQDFTLEFGQPLRSVSDAVDFFRLYSHDPCPQSIGEADVLPRLERRDNAQYPYYLPAIKQLGLLAIDMRSIPAAFHLTESEEEDQ